MIRKIGMVLEAGYPFDIRVEKEGQALIDAGFEVYLLAAKGKHEKWVNEVAGIKVIRTDIPVNGYKTMQAAAWNSLATVNGFVHPLWKKAIDDFVKNTGVEVLHVHDLPLVKTAYVVGQKYGIPTIADLHENYPAGLQVWAKWKTNPVVKLKNRLFFNYPRWFKYERDICEQVAHIIVVVEEMKARMVEQHQIPDEKITVISNTENKSFVTNAQHFEGLITDASEKFIITYFGGIGPHRGIDTVIKGMVEVKEQIPNALLVLVGSGSDAVLRKIKELIAENGVDKHVRLMGYQPFAKMRSYLKETDIALVPHNKNEHTDHTIPHKLFQYMLAERPVIVSDCKPLKRVVTLTNSGLIFEAGNSSDFAQKVLELHNDPDTAKQFAQNGYQAAMNSHWNWEATAKDLVAFYEKL